MDWNHIAPMAVAMTLILTTGGVLVLRPITKKLGSLLEVITQQKGALAPQQELARMREVLSSVESRLALLEERQNFAESLLASRQDSPQALPPRVPDAPAIEGPAAGEPRSRGTGLAL